MKKVLLTLLATSVLLFSFTNIVKKNYKVNIESSKIKWKGFKPTGSHFGTINLSDGTFILKGDKIIGGDFTIKMNSIIDLDMAADNEYNAKLVNHLKSSDFFDVEKYPNGTFKITNSEKKDGKTLIHGNLTLKNKTNPISFLADVKIDGDELSLTSETFKIDRSKYDVRYGSKSFFDDLKDKFINDEIEITIEIVAGK